MLKTGEHRVVGKVTWVDGAHDGYKCALRRAEGGLFGLHVPLGTLLASAMDAAGIQRGDNGRWPMGVHVRVTVEVIHAE